MQYNNYLIPSKGSFAEFTVKQRLPYIIGKIIKDNNFTEQGIISNLISLKEEVLNCEIKQIKLNDYYNKTWNNLIKEYERSSWFEVPFFWLEAYFYQRILVAVNYFETKKDPFEYQKIIETENSINFLNEICQFSFSENSENKLNTLLTFSLWGNRADMSLMPDDRHEINHNESDSIIINDLRKACEIIEKSKQIDIILDNSGAELFADLVLVEYLLRSNLELVVVLHVKEFPIFVSDAMEKDVNNTISFFEQQTNKNISTLSLSLKNLITEKRLQIKEDNFWNLPLHFTKLPENIKKQLEKSDCLISKGDANYRRFLEDRRYDFFSEIKDFVDYMTLPVLLLRTLKSEILVGITAKTLLKIEKEKDWQTKGKYGVMQLIDLKIFKFVLSAFLSLQKLEHR